MWCSDEIMIFVNQCCPESLGKSNNQRSVSIQMVDTVHTPALGYMQIVLDRATTTLVPIMLTTFGLCRKRDSLIWTIDPEAPRTGPSAISTLHTATGTNQFLFSLAPQLLQQHLSQDILWPTSTLKDQPLIQRQARYRKTAALLNGLPTLASSTPPTYTMCNITSFHHWHSVSNNGLQVMPQRIAWSCT